MNVENEVRIVFVTFPDLETARQIGTLLVESQLAACLNIIPGVESIYRWEGKINQDKEVAALIKTTESSLPQLERNFLEKHPYDVPEFLVMKPDSGFQGYLDWVRESCQKN